MSTRPSREEASIAFTLENFAAENRQDKFKADAGLALSGVSANRVLTGAKAEIDFIEGGRVVRLNPPLNSEASPWWRGSTRLMAPLQALVELSTGDWSGCAMLPQFILSLGVDALGVQTALYRPTNDDAHPEAKKIMARLAVSGLAGDQSPQVVQALRAAKHADPMMGVLAAWLHHAAGDIDNIRRTAFYFANKGQPVPFDVALLGRLDAWRDESGLVKVAVPAVEKDAGSRSVPSYMRNATEPAQALLGGAFPFLRQGWALLDPDGRGALYPPGLAELSAHLRSAPFTTFDPEGGRRLAEILFPNSTE